MIRLLTAEDIPAAAKIEQACFSDPWSETLLQKAFKMPGITSGFQKMKRER